MTEHNKYLEEEIYQYADPAIQDKNLTNANTDSSSKHI